MDPTPPAADTTVPINCPSCQAPINSGTRFCEACGKALTAPLSSVQRGRLRQRNRTKQSRASTIAGARIWLLVVAVIEILVALVLYFTGRPVGQVIPLLAVSFLFFGMWFWARWNPFAATLTGLIFYILFWIIDIVINPLAIFGGIIFRIIIISALISGLRAARKERASPSGNE